MRTFSVKLPEATKSRLDRLAAESGTTPHALMVTAIEAELDRREKQSEFLQSALRARAETIASGKAYDWDEFREYMLAKMRGEKVARPRAKSIQSLLKKQQ
jgi:predicted transcriptional regulator